MRQRFRSSVTTTRSSTDRVIPTDSRANIPMDVRIVTVADVFDALTSSRAYREALSFETALEVLAGGVEKGWWDKDAVRCLRVSLVEEKETLWAGLAS